MGEVRASNNELALIDYQAGMKYEEIAERYGVTINTVKSWKTRYKWSKDNEKGVQTKNKEVCKQKGGQPGNQNAAGHGAPAGNKNAVKTGEFEALFFDVLEEDERRLISMVQLDKEQLLLQEIQLLTVRERRMLKRIEDLKNTADNQKEEKAVGMTAVKFKSSTEEDTVEYIGTLSQIQAIEDALTRVQARKQKAIDSLHRYGFDDARQELEIIKVELEIMKQDNPDQEIEEDGFIDAMNGIATDVWGDVND